MNMRVLRISPPLVSPYVPLTADIHNTREPAAPAGTPRLELPLLDPQVARELRFAKTASGGLGRLRLGRGKYIPRRRREDAVRRVSTPERLHCVDHPRLVGDPVGLRSAGTWREDPRSFSRNVACRRRGAKEWSNDVHSVRVDSARGAG